MPGVVREGDVCSGHSCYPPRISTSWSPDVFVDGLPVERFGDTLAVHCCGPSCHPGVHIGQRTVYANGLSIQAVGDPIDCGSICAQGSLNVFID